MDNITYDETEQKNDLISMLRNECEGSRKNNRILTKLLNISNHQLHEAKTTSRCKENEFRTRLIRKKLEIFKLTRKNAKYRTERAEHDKKIIEMARKYTETINQLVNEKHALMTMALNETRPSDILSQQ